LLCVIKALTKFPLCTTFPFSKHINSIQQSICNKKLAHRTLSHILMLKAIINVDPTQSAITQEEKKKSKERQHTTKLLFSLYITFQSRIFVRTVPALQPNGYQLFSQNHFVSVSKFVNRTRKWEKWKVKKKLNPVVDDWTIIKIREWYISWQSINN
jgi:hypothetical protein